VAKRPTALAVQAKRTSMNTLRLTGLVAAPHSPFTGEGDLNLRIVEQQAAVLVEGGTSAAFVCGTTGEGASMTTAERGRLARRWVEVCGSTMPVIVQVGHLCAADARALAAQAQEAGAAAVSALSPSFFKPASVGDLVDFCARVASAAPALPFYYYHLPSMTGVALSMVEFMGQARERVPTFAGIKFTHNDWMEYRQCVRLADGSLDILFGRDEMLLAGLAAGAAGAVGSTYNYAAPVYRKMISAFESGNLAPARACQDQSLRLVEVLRRYGEIAAAKAIMEMMGVPVGPPRTPLARLDDSRQQDLFRDLSGLEIFTRPLRAPAAG
jgi:N-acetylneuraminate lyase